MDGDSGYIELLRQHALTRLFESMAPTFSKHNVVKALTLFYNITEMTLESTVQTLKNRLELKAPITGKYMASVLQTLLNRPNWEKTGLKLVSGGSPSMSYNNI